MKFKLTKNRKEVFGTTLFQIEATTSFGFVTKGELGGWIEKESNLSQDGDAWVSDNARVYGDAWVSDNAQVYGDARVSAKASFTKGWFIGGDDSGKITNITEKTGSDYWKSQYVLGDFEITPIDEVKETITIGDNIYDKQEVEDALKKIKSIKGDK